MPRHPDSHTLLLPLDSVRPSPASDHPTLLKELADFQEFGASTRVLATEAIDPDAGRIAVPTFVNEFWTARQRAASSLHEISYRACFKPQLPRFFIERLTQPGDVVHDPFAGRGTTPIEAALLGRIPCGSDINPLSTVLIRPRLDPPTPAEIDARLAELDLTTDSVTPEDLLVFYHPETLREIAALRQYLIDRTTAGRLDRIDDWIRMVALNRLTGHSPGFFSVYTMPPNQAVSVKSQRRINERRGQTPPRRHVREILQRKSRQLLSDVDASTRERLRAVAARARLLTGPADNLPDIPSNSVALVVTSPPFLNVVDYATDNWLRCWFLGLDARAVRLTVVNKLDRWKAAMTDALREMRRVLRPGGHVAFEVGEVQKASIHLEETVLACGVIAGLEPILVLVNDQKFTKTANCWGVDNNAKGTNTNRIVLFRKPA